MAARIADLETSRAACSQLEDTKQALQQELSTSQSQSSAEIAELEAQISDITAHNSNLVSQAALLTAQVHQLQQQHSSEALELAACNSGLQTQLSELQQQHTAALNRITSEVSHPLEKHIATLKQQLRVSLQRLQTAEQQVRAQGCSMTEAESRAVRAEAVLRKAEDRRTGVEAEKRRLLTVVRDTKAEVGSSVGCSNCISVQQLKATTACAYAA